MKVEFFGGPYDGLRRNCDVSSTGQEWRIICGPVSGFVCTKEEALTLPDVQLPVARYRLAHDGMHFVGMLA